MFDDTEFKEWIHILLYISMYGFILLQITYILINILIYTHTITSLYDGSSVSTCLLLILLSSLSLITACGCYMCLYICLYCYDYHRKRSITYDRLGSVV